MAGTGRGVASAGGVVASAAAAAALASGGLGTWDPQTWAIAGLFLIAGVGLPIETVREAASNWRLNAFTQAFVFGFPPVVVASAASTLVQSGWLDETVVSGVFIMACLPTTVGSGVAFTRSADGNVSAALLNSVAANLAGIFLTPALVHAYLGADSAVDPVASSSKLVAQAVLPTLVGMSMRLLPGVAAAADGALKEPSKLLSDAILLAIVVKTFVTAEQSEAGALDWTTGAHLLGFLALFMLAHKSAIWLAASSVEGFSRRDRVAALYMGSHKTLAFGVPLITTTFENDPNLTSYLLPLVAYHPALIAVSAALVAPLRAYVAEGETP
ncbi:putative sodium bile acid cotransporter [Ostreococcus tauri]|uniref:Putative sodium bile acid cotransporter n=1 Tax=Ostreococcus tauri TaxID=70448 RepID=A0A1Y5IK38_OSTTA|nr:putative sodium bile acid cotransporter [Ostreococcus tauri]